MTLAYVGIDPGKRGGIAVLDGDGNVLEVRAMPVIVGKKTPQYDLPRVFRTLVRHGECYVTIERLNPMPPAMGGTKANYQRGYATGMLEALCVAIRCRYDFVSPSVWQKTFWKGKQDTKQKAILIAQRLFPTADLLPSERARKPHDGMADALLIAEHGRRFANGLLT